MEVSRSLALKWTRKAAAAGDVNAMCTLAALLRASWVKKDGDATEARTKGLGDDVEAVKWATLAAEKVSELQVSISLEGTLRFHLRNILFFSTF